MKTLQAAFFLVAFVPLVKPAPTTQQDSSKFNDYETDIAMGSLIQQDYEMLSKDIIKVFHLYNHFHILTAKHDRNELDVT